MPWYVAGSLLLMGMNQRGSGLVDARYSGKDYLTENVWWWELNENEHMELYTPVFFPY